MRISGFFFLSATLKAKRGRTYGTRINIVVFKNYPVHIIKITLKMYNPIFFNIQNVQASLMMISKNYRSSTQATNHDMHSTFYHIYRFNFCFETKWIK